jgi:hypothetical protein
MSWISQLILLWINISEIQRLDAHALVAWYCLDSASSRDEEHGGHIRLFLSHVYYVHVIHHVHCML